MIPDAAAPIFVNGRFLNQPLTGVQRVAHEVTRALRRQHGARLRVLRPAEELRSVDYLMSEKIGRLTGQIWEQLELPQHTRKGILLNFGNTAPILHRHQLVVIHDAGIFSTPEAYSRKFRTWYKTLHNLLSRTRTKIVTVSEFSKQELIRHLNLHDEDVLVMQLGADHMERIGRDPSILATHHLTPGRFVLAVGTLAAHKNLPALGLLADAVAQNGFKLAITGALGGMAFNPKASGKLPQAAVYLGRVTDPQLKSLFEAAACLVMPSLYEGFGLPALEAMACGCAVIAADIPALRETCGSAALYCNPRLPDDILHVTMEFIHSPNQRAAMQQAALQHCRNKTWQISSDVINQIIPHL